MSLSIECLEKQAVPVLSIRTRTPVSQLPAVMGDAFKTVAIYLAELGEEAAFAPFAAYYNMDMEDLDVEMGFPVKKDLAGKGRVQASQIPAGRQVSCFFKGAYEEMKTPYDAMDGWMKEQGLEATGTAYEFYLNSPQDVPPQELQTIIMFPVK